MRRLLLLALVVLPAAAFAAEAQYDVRPAPGWADRPAIAAGADVPRDQARYGIYGLLKDHQARIAPNGDADDYYRDVERVLSPTAVQNASEISVDFDPSYQRLVLHQAVVRRGGTVINELAPVDIRIIDKESESGDDIYDGMLTAIIFLRDVRPGDLIDYSYSLEGTNPLLGGRYADEFDFGTSVPYRLVRHRVIASSSRRLITKTSRGAQPQIEHRGDTTIYSWERHDVQSTDVEDGTPDWYDPWETIQVTEFASWNDVAHWADALFQPDAASRDAVQQLAARIRREHASRDEQVTAAIRFVQDDIRYLGIEMGRNSHEPHQPAETLEQRYGDCKDKAFLLSLLLRELGVETYPAMVNTKLRHRLDEFLPSPFLFDHVIVQVIDRGHVYWIDGTLNDQGGTLASIETPNDERALVVRPDATALARIATPERGNVRVAQTLTAKDFTSAAVLDVTTTYTGRHADDMRAKLATLSMSDLAKDEINRYAADMPKIAAAGLPHVDDDRLRDIITVSERFSVHDLWRDGAWTYYPRLIQRHLSRPDTMVRSMPLAVDFPLDVQQTLTVSLPIALKIKARDELFNTPALRYQRSVDVKGTTIVIHDSLKALTDSVSTARVADHLAALNDISRAIGFTVSKRDAATGWQWPAAGLAVFVAGCTSLAVRRRRTRRFDRRSARSVAAEPIRAAQQ